MSGAAERAVREYLAEHGRTTAGGYLVADCTLCGAPVHADRLTTTTTAGVVVVVCRTCASRVERERTWLPKAPRPRRTP